MDPSKKRCVTTLINVLWGKHGASILDLKTGSFYIHFLQKLEQWDKVSQSLESDEERLMVVKTFLQDYYSDGTHKIDEFLKFDSILHQDHAATRSEQLELELAKIAVVLLGIGVMDKNRQSIMNQVLLIPQEMHHVVLSIIQSVVQAGSTEVALNTTVEDVLCEPIDPKPGTPKCNLLKSHLMDAAIHTSTPKDISKTSRHNATDAQGSPLRAANMSLLNSSLRDIMSPLNSLKLDSSSTPSPLSLYAQSPQVIQKATLRQKEMELRKMRLKMEEEADKAEYLNHLLEEEKKANLEKDAERAQLERRLSELQREHLRRDTKETIDAEYEATISRLQEKVQSLENYKTECSYLNREVSSQVEEIQGLNDQIEKLESRKAELQSALDAKACLSSEKENLKMLVEEMRQKLERLQTAQTSWEQERQSLQLTIGTIRAENKRMRSELEDCAPNNQGNCSGENLGEVLIMDLQSQLKAAQTDLVTMGETICSKDNELQIVRTEDEALVSDLKASFEKQMAEVEQRNKMDMQSMKTELEAMQEAERLQHKTELDKLVENHKEEIKQQLASSAKVEQELNSKIIIQREENIQVLQRLQKELDLERQRSEGVVATLAGLEEQLRIEKEDSIRHQQEADRLKSELEMVTGKHAEVSENLSATLCQVNDMESAHKLLQSQLSVTKTELATTEAKLSEMKDFSNQLEKSLDDTKASLAKSKEEFEAVQHVKEELKSHNETLQDKLEEITNSSLEEVKSLKDQILETESQIARMVTEFERREADICAKYKMEQHQDKMQHASEIQKLNHEIQLKVLEISNRDEQIEKVEKDLEHVNSSLNLRIKEIQTREQCIAELKSTISGMEGQVNKLEDKYTLETSELAKARMDCAASESKLLELNEVLDHQAKELDRQRQTLAKKSQDLESTVKAKLELQLQYEQLQMQHKQLSKSSVEEIHELKEKLLEKDDRVEKLMYEAEQTETNLKEDVCQLKNSVSQKTAELDKTMEALSKANEELEKTDIVKGEVQKTNEMLKSQLEEITAENKEKIKYLNDMVIEKDDQISEIIFEKENKESEAVSELKDLYEMFEKQEKKLNLKVASLKKAEQSIDELTKTQQRLEDENQRLLSQSDETTKVKMAEVKNLKDLMAELDLKLSNAHQKESELLTELAEVKNIHSTELTECRELIGKKDVQISQMSSEATQNEKILNDARTEINEVNKELERKNDELTKLFASLNEANKEGDETNILKNRLENENKNLHSQLNEVIEEKSSEVKHFQLKVADLESEISLVKQKEADLLTELNEVQNVCSQQTKELEGLRKSLAETNGTLEEVERSRKDLQNENEKLQTKLNETHQANSAETQALRVKLEEHESHISNLVTEIKEKEMMAAELSELKSVSNRQTEEIEESSRTLSRTTKELEEMASIKDDMQKQIVVLQNQLKETTALKNSELQQLDEKLNEKDCELSKLRTEYEKTEANLRSDHSSLLTQIKLQEEDNVRSLQQSIDQKNNDLASLMRTISDKDVELEKQKTLLGSIASDLKLKSEQISSRDETIAKLNRSIKDREDLMANIKQDFERQFASLNAENKMTLDKVQSELQASVRAKEETLSQQVATLENERIRFERELKEAAEQYKEEISASEQLKEEMKAELVREVKEHTQALERVRDDADKERQGFLQSLLAKRQEAEHLSAKVADLEIELKFEKDQSHIHKEKLEKIQADFELETMNHIEISAQLSSTISKLHDTEKIQKTLESELEEMRTQVKILSENNRAQEETNKSLLHAKDEQLQSLCKEKEEVRVLNDQLEAQVNEKIVQYTARIEQLSSDAQRTLEAEHQRLIVKEGELAQRDEVVKNLEEKLALSSQKLMEAERLHQEECDKAQEWLRTKDGEIGELEKRVALLKELEISMQAQREEDLVNLRQKDEELAQLRQDLEEQRKLSDEELKRLREQLMELQAELDKAKLELADKENRLVLAHKESKTVVEKRARHEKQVASLKESNETLSNVLKTERETNQKIKKQSEQNKFKMGEMNMNLEKTMKENKALATEITKLKTALDLCERRLRESQKQLDKAGTALLGDNSHFRQTMAKANSDFDDSLEISPNQRGSGRSLRSRTRLSAGSTSLHSNLNESNLSNVTVIRGDNKVDNNGVKEKRNTQLKSVEDRLSICSGFSSASETTTGTTTPLPASRTFAQCDNEPELFEWDRLSELQRRNTMYLPHLKSAYPVEMQVVNQEKLSDDNLRLSMHVNNQNKHRSSSDEDGKMDKHHAHLARGQSASAGNVSTRASISNGVKRGAPVMKIVEEDAMPTPPKQRKGKSPTGTIIYYPLARTGPNYHRPGPPTPGKQPRRVSGTFSPADQSVLMTSPPSVTRGALGSPITRTQAKITPKTRVRRSPRHMKGPSPAAAQMPSERRESVAFSIGFSPKVNKKGLMGPPKQSGLMPRKKATSQSSKLSSIASKAQDAMQRLRKPLGTRNFMETGI